MGRDEQSVRFERRQLQIGHKTRVIPALPTLRSAYIVSYSQKTAGAMPE
jgi:hypothetical protein